MQNKYKSLSIGKKGARDLHALAYDSVSVNLHSRVCSKSSNASPDHDSRMIVLHRWACMVWICTYCTSLYCSVQQRIFQRYKTKLLHWRYPSNCHVRNDIVFRALSGLHVARPHLCVIKSEQHTVLMKHVRFISIPNINIYTYILIEPHRWSYDRPQTAAWCWRAESDGPAPVVKVVVTLFGC